MVIHESLRPAMINTPGLILLFSRLIIFSLKVSHLHRKNWAGGMLVKNDVFKPLKTQKAVCGL